MSTQIIDVTDRSEFFGDVRSLFAEYARDINIDLSFQGFEKELAELPGCYELPWGRILLAQVDGQPAGCIALRPIDAEVGEVKRLYVRPEFRGRGLAKRLAETVLIEGFNNGYLRIVLDTLASMTAARKLYESLGFKETDPYYDNPLPDVVYYELIYHDAARAYVAKRARELGDGQWAVTFQNDHETSMDEVVALIREFCGYDDPLAEALMRMCHLHGSVIVKRYEHEELAVAQIALMEAHCERRDVPLRMFVYKVPYNLMG